VNELDGSKKVLVFLLLICLALPVSAWYNDTLENDTCVVIESNSSSYGTGSKEVIVKVQNDCGTDLSGNLAFLIEGRHQELVRVNALNELSNFKETVKNNQKKKA
jgi:hypothetical protein